MELIPVSDTGDGGSSPPRGTKIALPDVSNTTAVINSELATTRLLGPGSARKREETVQYLSYAARELEVVRWSEKPEDPVRYRRAVPIQYRCSVNG
jgi:hypothetical protein